MLQKLKLLYLEVFFPKKFADLKNPKKVTGFCQQCAFKSIKQGNSYVVCSFDKMVYGLNHTCGLFKNKS